MFAHNGDLPGVQDAGLRTGRFRPMGETDSELAFCGLLADLEELWLEGKPSLDERLAVVTGFAQQLRGLGPANFLYADGQILFIHSDRRRSGPGQLFWIAGASLSVGWSIPPRSAATILHGSRLLLELWRAAMASLVCGAFCHDPRIAPAHGEVDTARSDRDAYASP